MSVVDVSTLTATDLVALVEADALTVDAGLDLLDADDVFIADISEDLVAQGSSITHGVYKTIHRSARFNISKALEWGSQRLRPFLLLSVDGVTFARQNLGVFLPTVPERRVDRTPELWAVSCFDKLDVLNTPHGTSYSLDTGENVIDAVLTLLEDAGELRANLHASSATTPAPLVLPLSDNLTTLQVINELLDQAGFRALYVDSEGYYRSEPYRSPSELGPIWDYSTKSPTTTVATDRSSISDYYKAANVVIGIRDVPEDDLPVNGDGRYELRNQADGLTSIDARGGRVVRRVVKGQYVDHAALVVAVTAMMDSEKRIANHIKIKVGPNTVHGHFDVVNFRDDEIPVNGRFLVTDWVLPLDGADMSLSLKAV